MHGLEIALIIVLGISLLVWLVVILFMAYDILCDFIDQFIGRKRRCAK